jgi:D-threo-aldose 1-dehydrogenase
VWSRRLEEFFMRSVTLGGSPVRCSTLGFGCVKLTVQNNRAEAVRTLERAYNMGITHFDVARLYGFGQAEGILGEFLRGKRDRVTVTTKFGLRPSESIAKHRRLISIARQVLRRIPFLERQVKRRLGTAVSRGIFTPQEAAASLDISLRELGTDYVDIFLMHEATPADAAQTDLLAHLEMETKRGRIRAFGLGSAAQKLGTDLSAIPAPCAVLQFDSTALAPFVQSMHHTEGRGLITFGIMTPLKPLLDLARRDPAAVRTLSNQAQLDLSNPSVLAALLIDHAILSNPTGVSLVATVDASHLADNVRTAAGSSFSEIQRNALRELVRRVQEAQNLPHATAATTPSST